MNPPSVPEPMAPELFDELDAILDEMRTRYDETPQWEFCEGFMAALICCRRAILPGEYLQVLLGVSAGDAGAGRDGAVAGQDGEAAASFADEAQARRFMALWMRRWDEVARSLDAQVESLDDEDCYTPELMDIRGAVLALPEEERAAMDAEYLPAFAQVWALGFMFAVESWPEEWAAPRDKEAAQWLDESLEAIVVVTEDDEGKPTISPLSDDGPASVSLGRLNYFGDAIWAVYDLRELWRSIGPRVEQVFKADTPGRNDPCYCGSGKKYKKCHGSN